MAQRVQTEQELEQLAERERQAGLQEALQRAQLREAPRALSFTDCRTFGHAWMDVEADRNPLIGWYMKMRCERCGTERLDVVNRYGTVERRRYVYPDNYRDTDHWSRSEWRMQFLRKLS